MFHFRLQRVLGVRQRQREAAEREFAAAKRVFDELTAKLASLREIRVRWLEKLAQRKEEGISIEELLLYDEYLTANLLSFDATALQRQELQHELEEKRKRMVDAMRREKTIDMLRERAWRRYLGELARAERLLLDESAATRYILSRGGLEALPTTLAGKEK